VWVWSTCLREDEQLIETEAIGYGRCMVYMPNEEFTFVWIFEGKVKHEDT